MQLGNPPTYASLVMHEHNPPVRPLANKGWLQWFSRIAAILSGNWLNGVISVNMVDTTADAPTSSYGALTPYTATITCQWDQGASIKGNMKINTPTRMGYLMLINNNTITPVKCESGIVFLPTITAGTGGAVLTGTVITEVK